MLEQLLGTPPPPPPPDVPELDERKAAHRHAPPGHGAAPREPDLRLLPRPHGPASASPSRTTTPSARWRDKDGEFAIDPSGELPDGQKFQGPAELKAILKDKKELFARSLAEKMLTYALGRGLEYYDKCAVDKIVAALEKNDYRFSTLIVETVNSDPFQMRTASGQACQAQ